MNQAVQCPWGKKAPGGGRGAAQPQAGGDHAGRGQGCFFLKVEHPPDNLATPAQKSPPQQGAVLSTPVN